MRYWNIDDILSLDVGVYPIEGRWNIVKSCFLFGHRDTPQEIRPEIEAAVEWLYREKRVTQFYVGHYGSFDAIASAAVKHVKARYGDIALFMLIPYHPAIHPLETPDGFDGTFYPPLENVPKRYAIIRANRYMIETSDAIICYVNRPGNARKLLEYAGSCNKKRIAYTMNLADKRK